MNADLTPGLVAAGAGTALYAVITVREARVEAAMRAGRVRLAVRFPVALDPAAARSALASLSGLPDRLELAWQLIADGQGIQHHLLVPRAAWSSVDAALAAAMPGVRFSVVSPPEGAAVLAMRLFVPTPTLLREDETEAASRALLMGLARLRAGEQVTVSWALRSAPARRAFQTEPEDRAAKEQLRQWQAKTSRPGFAASGLVLVRAEKIARARELLGHVADCLRSRRGVTKGLRMTTGRGNRSLSAVAKTTRTSGWLSVDELLPLLALPVGDEVVPGVEVGASRELLTPPTVSRHGRRLFIGRDAVGTRQVAITAEAALHHVAVVGPTGSGKSVVLARGILDDLSAGYGGVLVDPKSDLIEEVLSRVPAAHRDRVVVLDPAASGPVPGLDLFGAGDADLRSDVILSTLKNVSEGWGPRIDQFLRLGLRTVADLPNPLLSDWLRLYSDAGLRARAIARTCDPIRAAEWATFEALSPAAQREFVAPAMSRITTLLARPALRAVLNQPAPKLNIARLLEQRKWLLVSLAPGTLGEASAQLFGAITTYLVWAAIEGRVAIPQGQRRPVFLYFDELQSVSALPIGLERFFERTRGLGCGVTVATQAIERLPEKTRASLTGNVMSLISFRAGHAEAGHIVRELPGLSAQDVQSLSRYEVAARVPSGGDRGVAVVTGRTEPLPPAHGQAAAIRARSAEIYGVDPAEVEAELRRRIAGEPVADDDLLGRVRRGA